MPIAIFSSTLETQTRFLLPTILGSAQLKIHFFFIIYNCKRNKILLQCTYMERQQNLLNLLEVLRHCKRLMYNILNANDSPTAQLLFDQLIGVESRSLIVDNQKSMLEDNISHRIDVRIAPDDVWLDQLK